MNETTDLAGLTLNPITRRVWLLSNALRCLAFDQALEAARAAEAFVVGHALEEREDGAQTDTTPPHGLVAEHPAQVPEEVSHVANPNGAALAKKRNCFALSEEHRERLLGRLVEGAKNAEVAVEFGLSPRQVQGLRMGCAREITERRTQSSEASSDADPAPGGGTALIDDIVRYLRQQDDVVVPIEDDRYLVNGRFRLTAGELVARANRMRRRQQKPALELLGGTPVSTETTARSNGHPLFWDEESISKHSSIDSKDHRPK